MKPGVDGRSPSQPVEQSKTEEQGARRHPRHLWWLAAIFAGVGLVLLLWPTQQPTDSVDEPNGAPASAASNSSSPPPVIPAPEPAASKLSTPTTHSVDEPWQQIMDGFAVDFTRPGSPVQWATRLRRWATPHLADQYQGVDPSRIPIGKLQQTKILATGESIVDFEATYAGGLKIRARIEAGPTGWRVTAVEPVVGLQ